MSRTHFRVNLDYSCLNVNELLARNRRDIWSLSESRLGWSFDSRCCHYYTSRNFLEKMKPANLHTKNTSFGQYFKNGSRVVPQKCFEKFVVLKSWKISEKNVLKTPVVSQFWWHVKYSLIFKTFYKSIIFPYPVNLLHGLHTYNPQFGQQRLPILSLKPTHEMMDRVLFTVIVCEFERENTCRFSQL